MAFKRLDFHQSSHHLYIHRIDIQLHDDTAEEAFPPDWNIESGAILATLYGLRVDFYPKHAVFAADGEFAERVEWLRYAAPNACTELARRQLEQYLKLLSSNMGAKAFCVTYLARRQLERSPNLQENAIFRVDLLADLKICNNLL